MSARDGSAGIEVVNAIIESARICISRGFLLDSWLSLDYGGTGQGFGGYVLGGIGDEKVPSAQHAEQPNLAAEWIVSILQAAGVDDWKDVPGKAVRVRREEGFNGRVTGIGHITRNDRWFLPEQRFAQMTQGRSHPAVVAARALANGARP